MFVVIQIDLTIAMLKKKKEHLLNAEWILAYKTSPMFICTQMAFRVGLFCVFFPAKILLTSTGLATSVKKAGLGPQS